MERHFKITFYLSILLAYISMVACFDDEILRTDDPDIYRNVSELITSKGYLCEDHEVTTKDGFILTIQRIPCPRHTNCLPSGDRPVVFLQHGLLDSANTWVMNSYAQSFGFVLADAGFDVWLGNIRGNTYSRRHLNLSPKDKKFWEWSWDEMAAYDLPAMIDKALQTSKQSQLFYVGHSQGTLIAFTRLSTDTVLSSKIKALFALGPISTVKHIKGAMYELSRVTVEIKILLELLGQHEFLPNGVFMKYLASKTCNHWISRYICQNILFLMTGFDGKEFNKTRLPVYLAHTPAGTSVQNVLHFSQMVKSGKCQMYDFGSDELNKQHYNQSWPPMYNMSMITVPTYLYSAGKDFLSDPQDVDELITKLHCMKSHTRFDSWQHLDFVWGLSARSMLYDKIISIMKSLI